MRYFIIFAVIGGCSVPIDPEEISGPEVSYCKDFRDGETFSFRKETVSRVSYLGSDYCLDVIDDSGKTRQLCKSHEAFMKCSDKPGIMEGKL